MINTFLGWLDKHTAGEQQQKSSKVIQVAFILAIGLSLVIGNKKVNTFIDSGQWGFSKRPRTQRTHFRYNGRNNIKIWTVAAHFIILICVCNNNKVEFMSIIVRLSAYNNCTYFLLTPTPPQPPTPPPSIDGLAYTKKSMGKP